MLLDKCFNILSGFGYFPLLIVGLPTRVLSGQKVTYTDSVQNYKDLRECFVE